MPLIHGDLEVEVVSGEDLVDQDNALFNIIPGDWSDVWVDVNLGTTNILQTRIRNNTISPIWNERVYLPVYQSADFLEVTAWDKDHLRSEMIGRGRVLVGDHDKAWRKDGPVFLDGSKGKINMKINYTPAAQAHAESIEVPKGYYKMRKGGSLTLYQDANATKIPGIVGTSDGAFVAMAETIRRAKKFIYIAAWSLWTGTRLERDKDTLGELLKQKAAEGVRVLLLLWNEKFSAGLCAGLIGTFDEDTDRYFEKTGVHVQKARRTRTGSNFLRDKLVEVVWTHHQKMLVADDGGDDIVAFLGGLDLTAGRWDTPEHELFSTLLGEHRGDFHNGFIKVKESQGPREPWHDVHGRLTGQAAIDLLRNFEERWRKQAPKNVHLLFPLSEEDLKPSSGPTGDVTWQIQVVRSIDKDSAEFDSSRVGLLDSAGGHLADTSLHTALVRLVRRAENFLYIESQYFIGSSQAWEKDQDCARNLVPLEIAERVVSKIRAGKEFRAYILLPMIPEGNPDEHIIRSSMKTILYYQHLTIQMMYKRIAAALQEVGSKNHPTDYLLVLCLGKKESRTRVARSAGVETPRPGSEESKWRQRSRFLIYVHSKMALADDSHILMGSANLNQRSLDGIRDTELAVSACQVREGSNSREEAVTDGVVRDFRKSLWAEHTTGLSQEEDDLADPASLAAIRRLKQLADDALETYVRDDSDSEPRSRFLRYPLDVSQDGTVKARPGMPNIPDFDIPAVGCRGLIPPTPSV